MRVDRTDKTHCNAIILDATDGDDGRLLEHLRNDPAVEVIDQSDIQASALAQLRPAPDPQLTSEPRRWRITPGAEPSSAFSVRGHIAAFVSTGTAT